MLTPLLCGDPDFGFQPVMRLFLGEEPFKARVIKVTRLYGLDARETIGEAEVGIGFKIQEEFVTVIDVSKTVERTGRCWHWPPSWKTRTPR